MEKDIYMVRGAVCVRGFSMAFVQTHRLLCFMLALLMFAGGSLPVRYASNPESSSAGLRLNVGGSGPGNYTTIQAALDAAQTGDTVFVYDDSSPFYEHLWMRTPGVTLQGEKNTTTLIDGSPSGSVIFVYGANCTILNLSIRAYGTKTLDPAVFLVKARDVTVHGVIVTNPTVGIYISEDCDRATVTSCTFSDSQTGIMADYSSSLNITGNILSNDYVGVYCSFGKHCIIAWNTFDCKSTSLQLDRLTNSSAIKNTIHGSNNGLVAILCTSLLLMDNTVTSTRWMNVRISGCDDTQFLGNTIINSDGIGLYLSRSNRSVITQCLFQGNDDGILLEYTNQTQVVGNTILSLKNDAYVITNNLSHHGNRWSHNYYTRAHTLPYLIPGRLKHNGHNLPFISWDLRPLADPPVPLQPTILHMFSPDTLYVGGSGPGNYTTIQAAVDNASDGDTIYVYPGQYNGGIILSKALTIQGADPQTTIIDSGGYYDGITILHDDCTIQGFSIIDGHFAITARNASHIVITSNILHDNFHGIDLRNTTTTTVSHDLIENNQYGIRLYDAQGTTVTHNTLKNLKLDAYFIGTTQTSIHNTWDRNYWGRPRFIAIIHGKYFPPSQPATPTRNLDRHPLLRPDTPVFLGKINKQQGGWLPDQ